MGKKKAPKAPDYNALATQQAQVQTQLARPDQNTPWGSIKWDGNTQTVTLDPQDQAALDAQQQLGADRSQTAQGLFSRARGEMSSPVDFNKFQDYGELGDYDTRRQTAEDAAYERATSRLDPYWQQTMDNLDVSLRNQGLMPGDEAYDRAMKNATMSRTDAYSNAQRDAVAEGRAESDLAFRQQLGTADYENTLRTQQITEELQRRGWTLNEINALIEGQGIELPNFPTAPRGTAPDYVGAAQSSYQSSLDRYNSRQAGLQGLFSGLGGIAKAGINYKLGFPV